MIVNKDELAARKEALIASGLEADPYAPIRERLARLDSEVAKLESRVETL